ncbi:MAG: Asp-tRNA(Asn)/Glu-tRNA(Gln) amidotransferase subunit GatA [Saprospiraceae bacterium]|nr:Asp-tRNA(Asn)/Glu-tRNA(Gln) amidotransferase subunit GatA [Saprospiraceae bacterium]
MPKYTTLKAIQADIQLGKTNCVALVDHYLDAIEQSENLNIYVEVFTDEARHRAFELDKKYRKNPHSVGRLFGAVVSLKDVICYANHEVTAGSHILRGFRSVFSATAVERILAEDAIIIGRTNCDQFAMGSDNTNTIYGAVRNAADAERVAGGSSGGAAVSVQADTCLVALGSDTGGSVRQPADFCEVIGTKPTYGRISRHGLLAYGSSFDQIGTLSHSVEDAALFLEIMAGADDFDSTASQKEVDAYTKNLHDSPSKYKIAYFDKALNTNGLDADIREINVKMLDILRGVGHTVEAVDFEYLDYVVPAYYVLTTAEASSNLSRFDGVRYGYRAENVHTLEETYRKSRTEGFSDEVKRRIILGTFVLSSGYYDAYYTKAQKARRLVADRLSAIFAEYDFIIMPVSPVKPWKIGEKSEDPVAMYLADIYTVLANLAGIPAIALGKQHCQFMAAKWEEGKLMAFAQEVEQLRNF